MEKSNKPGCLGWIIILVILSIFGNSIEKCSSEPNLSRTEKKQQQIASTAFESIMRYAFEHNHKHGSGTTSGNMDGKSADFTYDFKNQIIKIRSAYYPFDDYLANKLLGRVEYYTEVGSLHSMSIEESCGLKDKNEFYPVSIQGKWRPEGSGEGTLTISLSKENRLYINVFGYDWQHWEYYDLDSPDYALEVFNAARAELAEINETEYNPLIAIPAESKE